METTPEANGSGQAEPVLVVEANSATVCDCRNQITSLEAQVAGSREVAQNLSERVTTLTNNHRHALNTLRDYLCENYEDMGDHADEIASLMGIELEREVEVSVTVQATFTLTLKAGESFDEDNIDVDFSYENDSVYASIDRIDASTDED